nr:collagen alpha-1(I) chain-like isoform X1 [Kogia breviceps]
MKLPNPAGPNIPSGVQGGRGPGLRRRTAAPGTPETQGRKRPVQGGGLAAEGDPGPGHFGPVPAPACGRSPRVSSSRLFASSFPRVNDTHGPVTVTGRRARAGPGLGRGCGPERPPGLGAARLPAFQCHSNLLPPSSRPVLRAQPSDLSISITSSEKLPLAPQRTRFKMTTLRPSQILNQLKIHFSSFHRQ